MTKEERKIKMREWKKAYRLKNRDLLNEKAKARRQTHPNEHKKWREANPEKLKNAHLKDRYGITLEEYNKMLQNQNGLCKICNKPPNPEGRHASKSLHVDHDPKTTKQNGGVKVRGLLCNSCNTGLGKFMDDKELLLKAIEYLS